MKLELLVQPKVYSLDLNDLGRVQELLRRLTNNLENAKAKGKPWPIAFWGRKLEEVRAQALLSK